MKELSKTKRHLCNSCKKHIANCDSKKIVWGNGLGNDNVVECDAYEGKAKE